MKFTVMHGCHNRFVVVDVTGRPKVRRHVTWNEVARAICDRQDGVGADGLLLIAASTAAKARQADIRMKVYNPDGSEPEMCGNGIRCAAKYAYEYGLVHTESFRVETDGGIVMVELHVKHGKVEAVTVDMGQPRKIPREFHVRSDGSEWRIPVQVNVAGHTLAGKVISMGNPHCVIMVDDVDAFPVQEIGPLIAGHADFPRGTNVEFIQVLSVLSSYRVKLRTWERGVGETPACGSGACAVVAALQGADNPFKAAITVEQRGGTLKLKVREDGSILMTGPAVEVFSGDWPA